MNRMLHSCNRPETLSNMDQLQLHCRTTSIQLAKSIVWSAYVRQALLPSSITGECRSPPTFQET